jgi:tetratricopeptide (TPR) repeat protein
MDQRTQCAVPPSLEGAGREWRDFVSAFMAHGAAVPDRLKAVADAAPCAPALMAAKGLVFLLLGRRELADEARTLHAQATAALPGADRHDAMMVEALGAFLAGRPSRAAAAFDEILVSHPGDAFALKMAQAIRFLCGDAAGMRRSADAAIAAFADGHPHAGYAHGCHAFACEETGDLVLAERAGRRALELAPDDAWGLHAVAHVHEMRGHPHKGRDWLAARPEAFAGCSNFRHHVWWHYALFELELGRTDAVLALYDTEIRRDPTDDYRDIANAVSLLARLEGEGVDVGHRWEELAAIAERRVDDACVVFADLHYLMALLAAGRDAAADRMIARMAAARDGSEFGEVAVAAGAPAGGGLAALARGQHVAAFEQLSAARRQMKGIGGSNAQRDVFERLTIDAALRAGRVEEARALVKERAHGKGAFDSFAVSRLARCGPAAVVPPVTSAAAY